jgi:hypothetical protein
LIERGQDQELIVLDTPSASARAGYAAQSIAVEERRENSPAAAIDAIVQRSGELQSRARAIQELLLQGGDEAAILIKKLRFVELEPLEAMTLASAVGLGKGLQVQAPIPVDSELFQLAMEKSQSPKPWDRVLGAGLLGFRGSALELKHLADGDPDPRVRAAAIRALGHSGDGSAFEFLESYHERNPYPADEFQLDVAEALVYAKSRLASR